MAIRRCRVPTRVVSGEIGLLSNCTCTYLDPHAMEIVQSVDQTLKIAAMSQLGRVGIMLEECSIDIVIGGISVHTAEVSACARLY